MELTDKNGLTEAEFLRAYARKNYPRPYLTADVALYARGTQSILLVRRGGHPYLGYWALPGGFARATETTQQSALRELQEETGVTNALLTPIGLYSTPGRDPRGWVVSQAYLAVIDDEIPLTAGDDAGDARWFRVAQEHEGTCLINGGIRLFTHSDLAFDHGEIIAQALRLIEQHGKEWHYV